MVALKIWPGQPYPLGATWDGVGTNFSVYSEVASRVELCLFDDAGNQTAIDLPEMTAFIWHGYLPNVHPGQRYGYRIHGPWDPQNGRRCNDVVPSTPDESRHLLVRLLLLLSQGPRAAPRREGVLDRSDHRNLFPVTAKRFFYGRQRRC